MTKNKAAVKPARSAANSNPLDRGESIGLMEPMMLAEGTPHRGELLDLAIDLAQKSAGFRRALPEHVTASLADLVRAMNCYYSNLIEGHDTHPVDIERALKNDYSADAGKRDLQLEAKAHITVQKWIDEGGLKGGAFSAASICETHRRFCELLPEDLLIVEHPTNGEKIRVIPGELRHLDVEVGQHVPISPGALPRFLDRYEAAYRMLGKADAILAEAAAHHRLLWIHPFLDGNGRVARLLSHASQRDLLDTGGIWSIARGLARNAAAYKGHLAQCDLTRRNDLDGRGHLSQDALIAFTRFFLTTCIDQVTFMERLVQPDQLRARILLWADDETRLGNLPPKSGAILEAVLYRGELPRSETTNIVDASERSARRVVSTLIDHGVLTSESTRAPLRLAFPATLASRWMPGLFPEKTS
jgi:Fic family protein